MMDSPPVHDAPELTRFIEARYHRRHRDQLPALAALAGKVEAAHSSSPDAPAGLAKLLDQMAGDLSSHMRKEEMILFPAIRMGGATGLNQPIAVMRADHAVHEELLQKIQQITNDLKLPKDACGSWSALYAGLAEFISDFTEHLRLENEVLFPMFETRSR